MHGKNGTTCAKHDLSIEIPDDRILICEHSFKLVYIVLTMHTFCLS
jgi:hypothetical protein